MDISWRRNSRVNPIDQPPIKIHGKQLCMIKAKLFNRNAMTTELLNLVNSLIVIFVFVHGVFFSSAIATHKFVITFCVSLELLESATKVKLRGNANA
jgi:hypothetical protein